MSKKELWLKDIYRPGGVIETVFNVESCRAIAAYLLHKTGVEITITKTGGKYIVASWVADGKMQTVKIEMPAGVLYCFKEEHFEPLIKSFKKRRSITDDFQPSQFESQQTITITVHGRGKLMKELIDFLIEDANRFGHPDYEDFTHEIKLLKDAEIQVN